MRRLLWLANLNRFTIHPFLGHRNLLGWMAMVDINCCPRLIVLTNMKLHAFIGFPFVWLHSFLKFHINLIVKKRSIRVTATVLMKKIIREFRMYSHQRLSTCGLFDEAWKSILGILCWYVCGSYLSVSLSFSSVLGCCVLITLFRSIPNEEV